MPTPFFRRLFLILLLVAPISSLRASRTAAEARKACLSGLNESGVFAEKIGATHALKGTFELLYPMHPESIATQFPKPYERIMRLFNDRPSYLMGINRGLPPRTGMEMGQIFRNIHAFAQAIGEDLGYIVDTFPDDFYAKPLLYDYVRRFKGPVTKLSQRTDKYDPENGEQTNEIVRYGKSVVCSVWAELRLTLRLGSISRVNVTVAQLITDGVISNQDKFLDAYRDQEIDHFWFPKKPGPARRPQAVAIGETKVFDVPVNSSFPNLKRMHEQFERYLNIASVIGAQLGLPPQVHYFFVAGITQAHIDRMQQMTRNFNATLRGPDRVPVELIVFGNYAIKN